MNRSQQPIFKKAIIALTICLFAGIGQIYLAGKSKNKLNRISGNIKIISDRLDSDSNNHQTKARYIYLENNYRIFEVFIGKDWDDFKPEFEMIDSLNIGDKIDIYYEENSKTIDEQVNNLTKYIDKKGKPIFIKGKFDIVSVVIVIFVIILMILVSILKLKRIII